MYMYLLLFTTCLNVETEVQCTAVPSTLTLWMETKWSNPLLIRNLRWHADVTGIYKGKNIQIISKCKSPTFTIRTEYLYFYTLINSKFQQLSPPPPKEPMAFNWKGMSFYQNTHMVQNAWYIYFRPEIPLKQDSICWILNTYLDLISLHLTL